MLKAVWTQLYDKVKVVFLGAVASLGLALVDTFTSFDWTSAVGGPYSALIGIGVVGIGAYLKKEIAGHIVNQVDTVDQVTPFVDNSQPPPVAG